MVRHVLNKKLVSQHERLPSEPLGGAIALSLTLVFFLSVPAAFVSTLLAEALWLSTIALRYPLHRVGRRTR